ncbi:MAG: VirB4 family type IV secretion/conjugal transfer ATPase, partial [Micavibrio aeruginosavorus]
MFAVAKKDSTILGKRAAVEEAVGRFIPYTRLVDEETVKTKEGYYLKIIRIEGSAFETVDEIDINQRKNVRATLLRGLSNSRFAIYHHIIRRTEQIRQDNSFENDFCGALDEAYQDRLAGKRMFVNEQYITVVRRPAQGAFGTMADLSRTLFTRIDRNIQKNQELEDIKALNEAVSHILKTLAPYKPTVLGFKETEQGVFAENLSFLSYLVNFEKVEIRPPRMSIADYLPAKRISFGKEAFELRGSSPGDVKLGAILSLKEYADGTGPGMLDSLLRLPHEFVLTQSFGFVDRQASINAMRDTKRKMIAGEQGATSLEEDLDDAIDDLASGRSTFGEHHLT